MTSLFLRFWGKVAKESEPHNPPYHLLPYHCLDVAACGYQMVILNAFGVFDAFRRLGFTSRKDAALWFAYFLGCHDIGKYARGFQQLYQHDYSELVGPVDGRGYAVRHDELGYYLWRKHFAQNELVLFPRQPNRRLDYYLQQWMAISTGHHGMPPEYSDKGSLCFTQEDICAAEQFLSELKGLFNFDGYPEFFYQKDGLQRLKQQSWNLAGLVVLADWLGSDITYFPYYSQPMSLATYWCEIALPRSALAVKTIPAHSEIVPFTGVQHLFPFIMQATPLQQYAQDIEIIGEGARLFILEDVTGAGKTEAAMILAHRLLTAKQGSGLYIGLPTMATANAMYERLSRVYKALFSDRNPPSLVLAHGARRMMAQFSQSVWHESSQGQLRYQAEDASVVAECRAWFADSNKKALLAEVGVGTLDQAMMAIMPFRHQSLRLLGLKGKVLILDEVHAYDAYQDRLLESLLGYHASQGGSTILLTATLPLVQRRALLQAFNRGAGYSAVQPTFEAGYPWVSYLSHSGLSERQIDTREEVKRTVAVSWLDKEERGIALIKAQVAKGQCICWIRNSVDDAVASYRALLADSELRATDILLFHSRFAFCDRLNVEHEVLSWFGKTSNSDIRWGKILIATQVVEQSLDIDFDTMISDIAPIDLLIQRAGRLQRHIRDASGNRKVAEYEFLNDDRPPPELYILAPEWNENPNVDWLSKTMRNTGYVYADTATLWLTQSILRQRGQIRMPDDARLLIEFVYGEQRQVPPALVDSSDKAFAERLVKRGIAGQNMLDFAEGYNRSAALQWADEVNISTRLSESTIDLYLVYPSLADGIPESYCTDDDFPWEKSCIHIRESMWLRIKDRLPLVDDTMLEALRRKIHRPYAQAVLLTKDRPTSFYSREMGLYVID